MVASNFTSRLKVMVYTVFGLSVVLSFTLLFLTSPSVVEPKFWNEFQSILIAIVAIAIVAFGCLPLLKMRSIRIEQQQIVFQKYVFGSNIRKVNLKTMTITKSSLKKPKMDILKQFDSSKTESWWIQFLLVNIQTIKS